MTVPDLDKLDLPQCADCSSDSFEVCNLCGEGMCVFCWDVTSECIKLKVAGMHYLHSHCLKSLNLRAVKQKWYVYLDKRNVRRLGYRTKT